MNHVNDIAIIGMVCRIPGASDINEFWNNLKSGQESIYFLSQEELLKAGEDPELIKSPNYVPVDSTMPDADKFDAGFFNYSPKEAELIDPQQRIFLQGAWQALEQAGYNPKDYSGPIGVFAGAGENQYLHHIYPYLTKNPALKFQAMISNGSAYLPTRVAYQLNLKGPAINVQTACSTSLVAVHLASQSLLNGECDMALAGGVSILHYEKKGYQFQEGSIFSPDGHCRAFDAKAKGTVAGSGMGIVVLKRYEQALEDGDQIFALIKGSDINNDGSNKVGFTAPSVEGQYGVISQAMAMAEIEPESIGYIETHGTATTLGDPIEIAALSKAFQEGTDQKGFCAIGSLKSNVGHLDTAAGVCGLIKTALALKHQQIPPSLHFKEPNPGIDFANSPFYVSQKLSDWKTQEDFPRRAGVSSFGIGGTNAHVILEEAPEQSFPKQTHTYELILFSAKSKNALEQSTQNLAEALEKNSNLPLSNIAYTLQMGRQAMPYRRALVVENQKQCLDALKKKNPKKLFSHAPDIEDPKITFMFSGQGSQYINMTLDLYEQEPFFKNEVDQCFEILSRHTGEDFKSILYPKENHQLAQEKINQTQYTQPLLFIIEYALAKLWIHWGIKPQQMIGHSIGEYVAACLAEVFSLEQAIEIILLRGKLMQQTQAGAMLSVATSEEKLRPYINDQVALAAVNAPNFVVMSGNENAVSQLEAKLQEKAYSCRRLHTSQAFHSPLMDPVLQVFKDKLNQIRLQPPKIPYVSNVTGQWITAEQATDPNYYAKHLRQTVLFSKGMEILIQNPKQIFLEVGPGRSLATFAKIYTQKEQDKLVVTSLPHAKEDQASMKFLYESLGKLWLYGCQPDWVSFHEGQVLSRVSLPTYPFERESYWIQGIGSNTLKSSKGVQWDPAEVQDLQEESLSSQYDRPNLDTEYRAPSNELEEKLADIWQQALGIEKIGVDDNFFDLGGHSLLLVELSNEIKKVLKKDLPTRTFFQAPTIAALAQALEGKTLSPQDPSLWINLSQEALLEDEIKASDELKAINPHPENFFLTGTTGFVGAFLLKELLEKSLGKVYCLVRALDEASGKKRIQNNLEKYLLWNDSIASRIIPVLGDLSQKYFGLKPKAWSDLSEKIDLIYHCGASVKFTAPYSAIKSTNVGGTHEVLRLAASQKLKPLHFVSTYGVFSENPGKFHEASDINSLKHSEDNGYPTSKWVAEKLVMTGRERGIPSNIYRLGRVTGHSKTGACNRDDFFYRLTTGCAQLGYTAQEFYDESVDLTPVDFVAESLIKLSQNSKYKNEIFHLVSPHRTGIKEVYKELERYGKPIKTVHYQEWLKKVEEFDQKNPDSPLHLIVPLLQLMETDVADAQASYQALNSQSTMELLKENSIHCPKPDEKLLHTYSQFLLRKNSSNF